MPPKLSSVDKTTRNWLPRQRLLRDRKTNFKLIIYSLITSTNPANLAKIGAADFEINGLKRIAKNQIRNSSGT